MHILFLTDNFPPEVNAPASRTFEHCREWVKNGHEVTVITCAPNFPHGKVYAGYKNKLYQIDVVANIRVIRVWSYIAANEGFIKRILDYLSFMFASIPASCLAKNVDVVIGTSPQFFTVCSAYIVSLLKGRPFVFELRDLWPESIKAVGAMADSVTIKFFEKIELFLYWNADAIISVTESFKKSLIHRGVEAGKIKVLTNGVDLSLYNSRDKDEHLLSKYELHNKFVAGYIGTHGMAHGLETLLKAAMELQQGGIDDVIFLFLGHGAKKKDLVELAGEMHLDNVLFVDSVSKEEVVRYWSILDVSIIHLINTPLFSKVIPSKLFECMGMGIPVLHGVAGESAAVVEKTQCGCVFCSEDHIDLVNKLLGLKREPSRLQTIKLNGLLAANHYDRKVLAADMLSFLEEIVGESRG